VFDVLPDAKQAYWTETTEELLSVIISHLQHGDVVLVKGSLGARMGLIVDELLALGEEG
jgi:UDP-N-acetylmuramyl pentapeptide synthase